MTYSKHLLTCMMLLFTSCTCFAEHWEPITNDNKVFLDIDSINTHNESIYYNVKYLKNSVNDYLVVTVQNKGGNVGIVSSCKNSDYKNNRNLANSLTPKTATNFKALTEDSLLYKANALAVELEDINQDNSYSRSAIITKPNAKPQKPDYNGYMWLVQRQIRKNWNANQIHDKGVVVVRFKIARDGRVLYCRVTKSSGNPTLDNKSVETVRNVAPFYPIFDNIKQKSVDVEFTFDY